MSELSKAEDSSDIFEGLQTLDITLCRHNKSLEVLLAHSWQHYVKLRQLLVEGKLSVWYTLSFNRLLFSIKDFCQVTCELECDLQRKRDGDVNHEHDKVPKRHRQ
jgi:hypothetical protein